MKVIRKKFELKEEAEAEYSLTTLFHKAFPENVPLPSGIIVKDGAFQVIYAYAGGEPAEEVVRKRNCFEDFRRAIALLIEIQAFGASIAEKGWITIDDVIEEDENYFTNRISTRFFDQIEKYNETVIDPSTKETMLQNWWVVNNELKKALRIFYKDYHLGNMRFSPAKIIVFDFETRQWLPAQTELVKLLEFNFDNLTEGKKFSLIDYYRVKAEEKFGVKIDKRNFFLDYEFAALQGHLDMCGYSSRDAVQAEEQKEKYFKAQVYHYNKAREHLTKLLQNTNIPDEKRNSLARIESEFLKVKIMRPELFSELEQQIELENREFTRKTHPKLLELTLLKAGLSIAALVVASSLGQAYSKIRDRDIALINKYLFAGPKLQLVMEERPPGIGDRPIGTNYVFSILNPETGKANFLSNLSSPEVCWSPQKDKVLFEKQKRPVLFNFRTGEKEIVKGNLDLLCFELSRNKTPVEDDRTYALEEDKKPLTLKQIIETESPIISPDGRYLSLFVSNPRGKQKTRTPVIIDIENKMLYNGPDFIVGKEEYFEAWAKWSKTNKLAFYMNLPSGSVLYTVNSDFSDLELIAEIGKLKFSNVHFGPEGRIFFEAHIRKEGKDINHIFTVDKIGKTVKQLTIGDANHDLKFSSSKDGFYYGCNGNLCFYDFKGAMRVLTNLEPDDNLTFLLPIDTSSGEKVYFTTQEQGVYNLYVFEQGKVRKLTKSKDLDAFFFIKNP